MRVVVFLIICVSAGDGIGVAVPTSSIHFAQNGATCDSTPGWDACTILAQRASLGSLAGGERRAA